jgi:ribonuclease HI
MPRGSSKAKFYGVARGREPGVYRTWDEASAQVTGIKGAVHKSFGTEAEAAAWVAAQRGGAVGDAGPSESARLRSPAASPTQSRARPSSGARPPTERPPPARRAMSTMAGSAGAADADADEDVEKANDDAPIDDASIDALTTPPLTSGRRYLLCFDGACRGNPGPSGAGALIKEDEEDAASSGRVVFTLAQYLGDALTNNESEYRALIEGLRRASDLGVSDLRVVGDSKLVINQVMKSWKVKKENLMPLYEEAREVIETAPFKDSITMTHVEREKNAEADALANFAVDVGRERGAGVNVAEGFLFRSGDEGGGYGGGGGGGVYDGSSNDASRLRATKMMRDGFFAETTGGFASSRVARFARPVTLNSHTIAHGPHAGAMSHPMSVSHRNGKRAFPSVSSGAADAYSARDAKASRRLSGGKTDPMTFRVDTNSEARPLSAAVSARGGEKHKNGGAYPAPDPAMFASLTVSRMRRAEVTRLAPGLLRAARFFV